MKIEKQRNNHWNGKTRIMSLAALLLVLILLVTKITSPLPEELELMPSETSFAAVSKPAPVVTTSQEWKQLQQTVTGAAAKTTDNMVGLSDQEFELLSLKHYAGIFGFREEGREMMDIAIQEIAKQQSEVVLMEVGVWLGMSVARWLGASPALKVVGVDPFRAPSANHPKAKDIQPESLRKKFGQPSFNKKLAETYIKKHSQKGAERSILVEGYYPDAVNFWLSSDNKEQYPKIDVFYLDGGKAGTAEEHVKFVRDSLVAVVKAYPDVVLSGDDWSHGDHPYAFQECVLGLAKELGRQVYVSGGRTWIMPSTKVNMDAPAFQTKSASLAGLRSSSRIGTLTEKPTAKK
jgi:hypothetical protein